MRGLSTSPCKTPPARPPWGAADQFTYKLPPAVPPPSPGWTSLTVPLAGGTVVTISGTNFDGVTGVDFGSVPATLFLVDSSGSIVALAPAATAAGTVHITVTTAAATPTSAADQFTFVAPATSGSAGSGGAPAPAAPAVSGLSASSGPLAGGTPVTISGTNLSGVTGVLFGNVAASSFLVNPDGTISTTTPAESAGTVDVSVETLTGETSANSADRFTFAAPPPAPTVTGLSTAVGSTAGGTIVTISGTNFTQVTGVSFGDQAATKFTLNDDGTITATAPGGPAGAVDVTVTTHGGTSAAVTADQFTFSSSLPVVTGLSSASGFSSGGDSVTLFGVNLGTATAVFFGGVAAQSFVVNDDGTLTAVTPAWTTLPASPVNVTVQNAIGTSATSSADLFTVSPAGALPTVESLGTTAGPAGGGGLVMVIGTNFTDVTGVAFGGVASSFFQVLSTTTLVARVPATTGSVPADGLPVDVTVSTTAGSSAASTADRYTYLGRRSGHQQPGAAASGYTTGNDTLTIYGSHFTGTTGVFFGDRGRRLIHRRLRQHAQRGHPGGQRRGRRHHDPERSRHVGDRPAGSIHIHPRRRPPRRRGVVCLDRLDLRRPDVHDHRDELHRRDRRFVPYAGVRDAGRSGHDIHRHLPDLDQRHRSRHRRRNLRRQGDHLGSNLRRLNGPTDSRSPSARPQSPA